MEQAEQHDGGQGKAEAIVVEHLSKLLAWMDPFHQPPLWIALQEPGLSKIPNVWSLEALHLIEK